MVFFVNNLNSVQLIKYIVNVAMSDILLYPTILLKLFVDAQIVLALKIIKKENRIETRDKQNQTK